MNIPQFNAESSLGPSMGTYRGMGVLTKLGTISFRNSALLSDARARHASKDTHIDQRVIAAAPPIGGGTRTDCLLDCQETCLDSGKTMKQCQAYCNNYCSSGHPTYQCTNQDNSFNHYACLAGIAAWEGACSAECKLLDAVPIVGGLLGGACSAGCTALAANMKATCPDTVICV
jgi:hypothetical protein